MATTAKQTATGYIEVSTSENQKSPVVTGAPPSGLAATAAAEQVPRPLTIWEYPSMADDAERAHAVALAH